MDSSSDRVSVARQESDQPARHSAHHRHTLTARGRGHQHDPCVAGSRLDRHDQRVCRSGSGDESPDAGRVRIVHVWQSAHTPLAGRPVADAVPPQPVRSCQFMLWTKSLNRAQSLGHSNHRVANRYPRVRHHRMLNRLSGRTASGIDEMMDLARCLVTPLRICRFFSAWWVTYVLALLGRFDCDSFDEVVRS